MEVVLFALGVVVGAVVAWFLGQKKGREQGTREARGELASLAEGLKAGNLPDPGRTRKDEVPEVREMRQALAQQWMKLEDLVYALVDCRAEVESTMAIIDASYDELYEQIISSGRATAAGSAVSELCAGPSCSSCWYSAV